MSPDGEDSEGVPVSVRRESSPAPSGPLVVVVLGPEPGLEQPTRQGLEEAGFVVEASDAPGDAWHRVATDPDRVGVVLVDGAPGSGGDGLLRRLQADPETASIPVLVLAPASTPEENAVRAFEQGAAGHVTRPFGASLLVAWVQALLQRRFRELALRARLQQAEEAATTDALTRLGNRREFDRQLRREIAYTERHGEPFALLLLDLDHFKSVNDTHGHTVGDRVLVFVADRIRETVRRSDQAFRLGGEEFAVLLRGASAASAFGAAQRLRHVMTSAPLPLGGSEAWRVTFSGGVASADSDNDFCVDRLLERADQALYRAKNNGRNRTELDEVGGPSVAPRWSVLPAS